MTTINNDQFVIEKLSQIENIPPRNTKKAASARIRYLTELKELAAIKPSAVPVSISPRQRLNEWINKIQNLFLRKDRSPMFTTLATMVTVLVLAFGGAGATVYAAQDSLPNDLLYPLKLTSEQFRMDIATKTQAQFDLSLEFANRRMGEITTLTTNGEIIPPEVMTQLENKFKNAFQLAAGMSEEDLTPALIKLQATIREQQHIMAGLSSGVNDAVLARIREMLQTQEQICETGLADPLMFRIRIRQQQGENLTPPEEQPTNSGSGSPQGNQGQGTSNPSNNNSGANTGSQAGSGNSGTGTGTCTDCVPVQNDTGSGAGPDAGFGEGAENSTPPEDGTGAGIGPNENPGTGGESNSDPTNNNNNQEENNTDNENSNNGNSDDGNSGNEDSNTSSPSSPEPGGSENSGGGKGKP